MANSLEPLSDDDEIGLSHGLTRRPQLIRQSESTYASLLMFVAIIVAMLWAMSTAQAEDLTDVYFAGVAFTGAAALTDQGLNHSNAILTNDVQLDALNQRIIRGLQLRRPTHLDVRTADLAQLDSSTSAIAMAIALDRETVVVEQVDQDYKVLVEIAAQILFFDFREKSLIAAVPVTVQRIDLFRQEPSDDDVSSLVRYIFSSDDAEAFVANVVIAIENSHLPSPSARRLQVVSIRLDETASAALSSDNRQAMLIEQTLGNEFTKIIGDRQKIGMLPFQAGQAIGGAMAARFADGRVYNLSIPDPDYAITLAVGPLKEKTLKETAVATATLYGAIFRVTVSEPFSGKNYFDQSLRRGATRTIPITQTDVDASAAYYETLLLGLDAFAESIDDRRSSWVGAQVSPRPLRRQLKELSKLLRSCR